MTLLNVLKNNKAGCCPDTDSPSETQQTVQTHFQRPRYRVEELETAYRVEVDLPSVVKAGLEISLADGVLTIVGNRVWALVKDWNPVAGEVEDGIVYRLRLSIGDEVDGDSISAELDSGVLTLTLAKAEEKKPRRIAIA